MLTPLQGRPRAGCRGQFFAQISAYFYATPMKPPFFWLGQAQLNGIISPPYPEVTLDNFGFLVGGRLAARRAVFWPPGRILAILGQCPISIISTLNFGPWSTKLGGTIRATKKMTHIDNGHCHSRNYGETTVFTFCQKVVFGPKIHFFPKKHPKTTKRLIFIWENGTFFFAQLCPVVARTWFRLRSESFFLGPKIRILAQKSVFFYKTLDFVNGPFVDLAETIDLVPSD